MSKIEQQCMFLVGILIAALGAYVGAGWLLTIPSMVKIIPDSTAIVFNTAICFIISGIWFILKSTRGVGDPSSSSHWLGVIACALLILPVLVLVEIISGYDLGIDWVDRHSLVLDRNPTPGRMAPNTCMAFLLIGAAFLFDHLHNLRLKKIIFTALGTCTLFLGASSLFSYLTNLDWLYSFIQQNRMAIPTAMGLTLIGIVLIAAGRSRTYDIPSDNKGEDVRLTRIAAIIMVVLSLASGLTGFIVLKQGTDQALRDGLQQKATNSADSFSSALERRYMLADKLLSFPVFAKDLVTLAVTPTDADSLEHIQKVGVILLSMGFSSLQIQDNNNNTDYSLGKIITHSDISVPVTITNQSASLFWDNGLVLHVERPIINKDGVTVGKVVTEQPMTGLDRLLHAIQFSGKTTDAGLCHRNSDLFDCFPSRWVTHTVHAPMFNHGQPAFPMAHALLGETGIIYANDIRGISVLAAYTPIGDTGLGLVTKIDTTEIYSFVRDRLHILIGLLALFVLMGTYVLRVRIQPLAARLVRSEQRMREANEVLEQAQQKLTHMAQYDALTGLPNRSLFLDRLSLAVRRTERSHEAMALMFLDLDGFKEINDNYGHQAGDTLLKRFAERLTEMVRKTDTVARLAGDEFTIILEELVSPEQDAQIIANKIIQAMMQPFDIGSRHITITTSIGVAINKSGTMNVDEFIHSADTEMYKAKNKGKNQFSLAAISQI